jgi:RNA 2',3'-cyclic 3'-phosphodiesterase
MARDRTKRPEAKALRLFVAIEVPDDAKAAAAEAVKDLRSRFPKARWASAENQHITLKFLGRTWPRLEPWVRERVVEAAASLAPFEVRLDGLGAFRSPARARVLWAGLLDEPPGSLAATATGVDGALAAEFPPERRPFSAHLTLARSDPPLVLDPSHLDVEVRRVSWRVERLVLFRSHLQRPAPRYEPLLVAPLGLHA